MTALAGYWARDATDPRPACDAMLKAQSIYGHHSAQRSMDNVALGRRLWPLTPEDAFDTGPLISEDGRLMVVADARIDNRDTIIATLALGPDAASMSDAAIILAAVARWGDHAFDRLHGAFAVVCWDNSARTLTLARDPLGERPLHYHCGQGFVALSSMPKGLHALPAVPYAARETAIADFLALLPDTVSETVFEGIDRVLPGHFTVIDEHGRLRSTPFWHPPTDPLIGPNHGDYAEMLLAELDRAVATRLRRVSGAVGSHLSAGLDSSGVTASAALQLSPDRLFAFTAAPTGIVSDPNGGIADESHHAAVTAALYPNIAHVRVQAGPVSPLRLMDRQFQLFERPILNPSNATWNDAINDAARARNVTVMLTGQMGNFSISHDGLQHLHALARRGSMPALLRLARQMKRRGHGWAGIGAQAFGPFLSPRAWSWIARRFDRALSFSSYSALAPHAFDTMGIGARADERGLDLSYRPWRDSRAMRLWGLRRVDLGVYNKGTLAGWGIDLRDPTADRALIELTLRIPDAQFIRDGETRSLARRAFAGRLPAIVLKERRRGVQAADWRLGLDAAHQAIGEDLAVFERNAHARGLIDIERLKRAHAAWPDADASDATTMLYRHAVLRAMAAGHFLCKVGRTN